MVLSKQCTIKKVEDGVEILSLTNNDTIFFCLINFSVQDNPQVRNFSCSGVIKFFDSSTSLRVVLVFTFRNKSLSFVLLMI